MNRRILVVTILVALAVLLNNWLSGRREQARRAHEEQARHLADYFMNDFTTTTMDARGRPTERLSADAMTHYSDDGSTDLTRPRLTLFEPGAAAPWQLDAAQGRIEDNGARVLLSGGVTLSRDDPQGHLALHTDHLLLLPHKHYAETDAPLHLDAPHGTVDAVGLQAYLDQQRLVLRSQVKGTYDAPH